MVVKVGFGKGFLVSSFYTQSMYPRKGVCHPQVRSGQPDSIAAWVSGHKIWRSRAPLKSLFMLRLLASSTGQYMMK